MNRRLLPAKPLVRYMTLTGHSLQEGSKVLGKNAQWLEQRKRRPFIDLFDADRVACHLGVHPSFIWGEQWWNAISQEKECRRGHIVDPDARQCNTCTNARRRANYQRRKENA